MTRKLKWYLGLLILLDVVGILYSLVYFFYLKEIETMTFDVTYGVINTVIALPLVCFSSAALLTLLFLKKKFIRAPESSAKYLLIASIIILLLYVFICCGTFMGSAFSFLAFRFVTSHPLLFVIPGILFILGSYKQK